ncbi:uncharacterized protein LOC143573811 [Bidens hawaiensis]|uniref:uncharacterized protein LOC143573811 n=1 Tax=Bidens hawaiensis TaxID=980011 RepID=UPI004049E0BC
MERSSKHLHNFDLPTWGKQKFLKCMNVDPLHPMPAVDDEESSESGEFNEHRSSPPPPICSKPRSEGKTLRPRRNLDKKEERPKFSIALSRKEIEEDFLAMTGKKPPRRPSKHPKSVQTKLDVSNCLS